MANWNGSDGFKQQKKRNFVYKSAPSGKNAHPNPHKVERTVSALQMTSVNCYSSPRKKMRSSYSFYDKSRSDQQAAQDLCSDLPLDAFEDDVLDDFGDDFTAEELCQVAEETEQQARIMTQTHNGSAKEETFSQDLPKQIIPGNNHSILEDYFDDNDQGLDLVVNENLLVKTDYNNSRFSAVPSKGMEMKLGENPNEKSAVLFSAESHSSNNFTNMDQTFTNGSAAVPSQFDQKILTEDIKLLQEKLAKTQDRIKELEEQNYIKDGNLKMLQDSLEHLKTEETKSKEKLRNLDEQKRAELKELQRNHAKIVEQLNSKICFQAQEIKQAKEQRLARQQVEHNSESPKKSKPSKLTSNMNVISTGESFFAQNSTTRWSPKGKKLTKAQKSPEKLPLKMPDHKQENERTLEKKLLSGKNFSSKSSNVEITQRLFKLPNNESDIGLKYESSPFSQSLLSLLRLNLNVTPLELGQIENGIVSQNGLVDQELLNSTILSSELKNPDVCQAIEAIQELTNTNKLSTNHNTNLKLVHNFKASAILDSSQNLKSAVKLLPLLEYHISLYADLRVDKDDDSLVNTCPSSPVGDASDVKDRDSIAALSLAFDSAVQSLRCLAVLVSYSREVCEVLLRPVRTWKVEKDKAQVAEAKEVNNTTSDLISDDKCDIISLLLPLVIPQPNEPSLVSLASLRVIEALARHCSQENGSGILARLSDTILPQCLSKEYCLNTLSLVIEILVESLCGRHVCSQSDECVLLKIYQGCLNDLLGLSHTSRITLQLKVVVLVDGVISSNDDALPYLTDCHCTIELLKLLVCVLHTEMIFLEQLSPESLITDVNASQSLQLLYCGVNLFANLFTFSKLLLSDLHMLVGHKYTSLIMGSLRLVKDKDTIGLRNATEMSEVLIDLLEMDNIEYSDVFEDAEEDADVIEEMEVGE